MKKSIKAVGVVLACFSMSACIETLQKVNDTMASANQVMSGKPATGTSTQRAVDSKSGVKISPEQEQKIMNAVNVKTKKAQSDKAIAEASQNIAGFIKIESCLVEYDPSGYSALNVYAAHGKVFSWLTDLTGLSNMKYHDKATCASVLRLQGWSMPANNALRFEVTYVSDSSGESAKRDHELIKQPSGEWLFTR